MAPLLADGDRDAAGSLVELWTDQHAADSAWGHQRADVLADYWQTEYAGQTTAAGILSAQLALPWSGFQVSLATAKHDWWQSQRRPYLAWIDGSSSAAESQTAGVGSAPMMQATSTHRYNTGRT